MFCRECGTELKDGASFCTGCGRPLGTTVQNSAPEAGQQNLPESEKQNLPEPDQQGDKKKKGRRITLIAAGIIAVIALVVILLFVLGVLPGGEDEEDDRETGRSNRQSEESEERSEKESEPTKESESEEPPLAEELTVQQYLERDLIPAAGLLDIEQVYKAGYTEENYGDYYAPRNAYIRGISGIAGYDIRDYDKDGEEELLVLMLKEGTEQIGLPYHTIWIQMFEKDATGLTLAAEMEAQCGGLGGMDIQKLIFYVKESDSAVYIAEEITGSFCVCADGAEEGLHVLHYTGRNFATDLEEHYIGSDFSDREEYVAATASRLKALGFTESAADLTTDMELDMADGLDMIFLVDGRNPELFEQDNTINRYYETYDISYLGEVGYRFYRDIEDYRAGYRITGYTTENDDFSVSANDKTIYAYFDRIIFEGKQSQRIDWLNRQVEALEASYQADLAGLEEELQYMQDFSDDEWYYQPMDIYSIYYDENGNVSIGYIWYWYMGGVTSTGWSCLNYDLESQTELSLWEVLGVDYDAALQMVRDAMLAEFGDVYEDLDRQMNDLYQFDFCFTEDQVIILVNPYTFNGQGCIGLCVEMSRPTE